MSTSASLYARTPESANALLTLVNPVIYSDRVPETTGHRIGVRVMQKADNRRSAVFLRLHAKRLQWSGLGGGAFGHAGFLLRRYANSVKCSATPIGVGARVPNPAKGGRIMRQASARPSKVRTNVRPAALPDEIFTLLDTRTNDYGTACKIGRQAADEFAECLRDERYRVGFGLLPKIAEYIAVTGSSPGVAVGFWARVDELIVRASGSVCFPIMRNAGAKEVHERHAHA
jgi:hypothetical protein